MCCSPLHASTVPVKISSIFTLVSPLVELSLHYSGFGWISMSVMTIIPIMELGKETNVAARNEVRVSESHRLQNDSFSRHGLSPETKPRPLSATSNRALHHRPSPLVLPPLPPSSFGYSSRGQQVNDESRRDVDGGIHPANHDRSASPGSASSQRGQKRLYTPDSEYEGDDASCPVGSYSSTDDDAEERRVSVVAANGPLSSRPDSSKCLCLRPKKIPRPRNIFMLYRQQTHADVLAENPGIANPIISKIIGERWRSMSDEEKLPWKELAEEEKRLHREMYPNYRYQPKRAGKAGGGQQGVPGNGGSLGMGKGSSSDRCEKCGLRYIASPKSARSIPASARTPRLPPSPCAVAQGHLEPASSDSYDHERSRYSAPFPSPGYLAQRQSPSYGQRPSSRDAHGRRPLPQDARPGTRYLDHRVHPDYQDEAFSMPFPDEKRRRYDAHSPYAANPPPDVAGDAGRYYHQFTLPHRPRHYDSSPLPAQTPHSANVPRLPDSTSARIPAFRWMGPPLPPPPHQRSMDQTARGYAAPSPAVAEPNVPRLAHPDPGENHRAPSARLPPPSYDAQGYYFPGRGASSGGNGVVSTPLTAMAGLSMHQTPTPTPVTPSFVRASDNSISAASSRERLLHHMHPRPTSGYTDESLELPPLMTGVPSVLQSVHQGHADTIMVERQVSSSSADSQPALHAKTPGNGLDAARMDTRDVDAHTLVSTATLDSPGRHGDRKRDINDGNAAADKDSQASGVRAMIMSISYLKKLEVLRRICPPRPFATRRGPIISIEGHNAALRRAVGKIVERALVQSGECDVMVRTAMNLDGKYTNSGIAPSPASGCYDTSRRNERESREMTAPDSLAFDVSAIIECMILVSNVQTASKAIVQHVTLTTTSPEPPAPARSYTRASTVPKIASLLENSSKLDPAGPLSPTTPSTSVSPTIRVATLSRADGAAETAPAKARAAATTTSPASTSPPSPPAPRQDLQPPLLPVALLTTGFSLAIADKCAISVGIDDSFGPVDHWEYMATMWRGTPGPDLVVYADASPPPPAAQGGSGATVHTVEQDGVLVVHVPLPNNGGGNDADNADGASDIDNGDILIDQKTERRLAFEVMEFVRSGRFGVAKGRSIGEKCAF